LYELVALTFRQEDLAKLDFPRLAQEDPLTLAKIQFARADLLYFAKDWERCGQAFDAAVAEDPDGPLALQAAYAAVLCYQSAYAQAQKPGAGTRAGSKDLAPRELTEAERRMLAASSRFVCDFAPEPGDREGRATHAQVKYVRARTWFEAQ